MIYVVTARNHRTIIDVGYHWRDIKWWWKIYPEDGYKIVKIKKFKCRHETSDNFYPQIRKHLKTLKGYK